jgi:hypothetical protein
MSRSLAFAHQAVIFAADQPAIMHALSRHGNPAIRRAAETLDQIVAMHRRHDYNQARELQIADNALFCLPLDEIEKLCAAYEAR